MVVYSMAPSRSRMAATWATVDFFCPQAHIDTEYIRIFLGQDGIHGYGGLSDLAVADDQLALTFAPPESSRRPP